MGRMLTKAPDKTKGPMGPLLFKCVFVRYAVASAGRVFALRR